MSTLRTLVCFSVLTCASASAQELLALDFQGQAFGVDVATGQQRFIAASGANFVNGMASHDGVLYAAGGGVASTPSRLFTIDPITAQATLVIADLGGDVRALCTNAGTNELFAIMNGSPDRLVRIDVTTGVVTNIGNTGMTGIQALDDGAGVGALFGWDVNLGLVQISRTSGAAVVVAPGLGAQGAVLQFLSLVQENNAVRLLGGGTSLYEVNRFTGVVTQIGSAPLSDLRGAERRRGIGTAFGVGCATAVAGPATIGSKAEFLAGTTPTLLSTQHQPNCLAILVVGLSNTVSLGTPLPILLDPIFGTSGCNLWISADLLLAGQANGIGSILMPFTIPAVFGFTLHFQIVGLESVPGGLSFTNGFTVRTPF